MMIKNIIFDLGKVLIDYDYSKLYGKINVIPDRRALKQFEKQVYLFGAGKISKSAFKESVCSLLGLSMSFAEFSAYWCSMFSPIPMMEQLALDLHNNYSVYIFSNTDAIHFPFLKRHYPFLDSFEKSLMLSYEIKAMKPEKESYQKALGLFDLVPEQSLFIDDRPENIKGALDFGMKGIVHKSFDETLPLLKEYGIDLNL